LNYRHAFHAGNFADLFKHAALLRALGSLGREPRPLLVVDTHAGAGRYLIPLAGLETGEAVAIRRLLDDEAAPAVFAPLTRAATPRRDGLVYPGSPLLAAMRLRADDRLLACELRPDDGAELQAVLKPYAPRAEVRLTDGYEALGPALRAWRGPALVLIDPPFERGDDYRRVAEAAAETIAMAPGATLLIWTPFKDLETFDALLRDLELRVAAPTLAAELRLRPPLDPLKLNGCALLAVNPPEGLEDALQSAGGWIVEALGDPGGGVRTRHLATAKSGGAKRRRSAL
jgi:23S rRNA (adenine2030-N6)-methyltransferase